MMKQSTYKTRWEQWFPKFILVSFLVFLFISNHNYPVFFNNSSSAISLGVTTIYVFLTYEILKKSQDNRIRPHFDLKFILVSNFNSNYLNEDRGYIKKTQRFLNLESDLATEGVNAKDIIFIRTENIGKTVATSINVKINYNKISAGETQNNLEKVITFNNLRENQKSLDLVEVFDNPSRNDSFRINSCLVEFNDINGEQANEKKRKQEFDKPEFSRDDAISIRFE